MEYVGAWCLYLMYGLRSPSSVWPELGQSFSALNILLPFRANKDTSWCHGLQAREWGARKGGDCLSSSSETLMESPTPGSIK